MADVRTHFLICTGGGPGAMEAGHLGAALGSAGDATVNAALEKLKDYAVVPELGKMVDAEGHVDTALAAQAYAWFKPAYELAQSIAAPCESLAIPTWHYGHEPPTPFATHIAKYFQNSVREDGLVTIAQQGIICTPGKAGTLQEIFQDGVQNAYLVSGTFSPMVLFGVEYWTRTFPVVDVLKQLFGENYDRYVLLTDDEATSTQFIEQFAS